MFDKKAELIDEKVKWTKQNVAQILPNDNKIIAENGENFEYDISYRNGCGRAKGQNGHKHTQAVSRHHAKHHHAFTKQAFGAKLTATLLICF